MKNKYILYIACAALTIVASCKRESFLNRTPLSDITPGTFFKNETDLQLYCNQYYSALTQQNFLKLDDNSDDKANASVNALLAGTYTIPSTASNNYTSTGTTTDFNSNNVAGSMPLNINQSGTDWNFALIRACNFFLANYQKADIPDATKNIYVGETLFFRANDFWKKVKAFGDVSYVNRYIVDTSASILYGPRMPHKQVMDSVIKDINFAVANLPVTAPDGRLNKYAALALKARVCLWEGTYRKYFGVGDETTYLQGAVDAAEQLMNAGKFSLYSTGNTASDYYNLFIQTDLTGNTENIMSAGYKLNILTNDIDRQLGQAGDGYSKDFVNSILCSDGLPTTLSPLYKGDDTPEDESTNRDPRYKQQIATRGFDFLAGDLITLPRIGTTVTSTGYQPIKGRSSSQEAWNANQSEYDFFIFRYAEVLLIEAEAKAELGLATQAIIDNTVNKLRDRVGMPHMIIASLVKDPKSNFPTLPVLIDEIRRERRVELGSEGFRFDDIKRWHAGTLINNPNTILGMKLTPALRAQYTAESKDVSNVVVDGNNYIRIYPGTTTRSWNDKMYLLPIPTQEISLNPALKQNPGW
ncbi:Starch-binding associating with outer membrane [Mucilaginibacter sp. OK268]|uniref:RagB/SusD family nutrient uptake outer membrane protein n=1 Tax=Mucilaginibacter sp. OK268 TaxID=1881048 RepID=UPI00088D7F51|nr:RagB/SusD family nutrient uptake outer membrane protein [Mucilaginibacter sp. OK268]SDP49525.1 Starch-binding associating with outer membrane [Mucilaginibacter sp. OK268]